MIPNFSSKFLFSVLVLGSFLFCSSRCSQASDPTLSDEIAANPDSLAFNMDSLSLPLSLPSGQPETALLNNERVHALFAGYALEPAFGEARDVPGITENYLESKYYSIGKLRGPQFLALVLAKEEGNNTYYYLCTFAPDGAFINGMCVAFTEGTSKDRTERRVAINDDFSLQLMQLNTFGGQAGDETQTRFYEISPEGKFSGLSNTSSL